MRKKVLNNNTTQKSSQQRRPPAKNNKSMLDRPNDELVAQITSDLGCERYLVEMIERDVLQRKPKYI